jgi:hypothetical protein
VVSNPKSLSHLASDPSMPSTMNESVALALVVSGLALMAGTRLLAFVFASLSNA